MNFHFLIQHQTNDNNDDTSLLIDTGVSFSVINNEKKVLNIHNSDTIMNAKTNGGRFVITKKADLSNWFKVWFDPTLMINILYLAEVSKHYRITIDTDKDHAIFVHLNKTNTLKFVEACSRIYIWTPPIQMYLLIPFLPSYLRISHSLPQEK